MIYIFIYLIYYFFDKVQPYKEHLYPRAQKILWLWKDGLNELKHKTWNE